VKVDAEACRTGRCCWKGSHKITCKKRGISRRCGAGTCTENNLHQTYSFSGVARGSEHCPRLLHTCNPDTASIIPLVSTQDLIDPRLDGSLHSQLRTFPLTRWPSKSGDEPGGFHPSSCPWTAYLAAPHHAHEGQSQGCQLMLTGGGRGLRGG